MMMIYIYICLLRLTLIYEYKSTSFGLFNTASFEVLSIWVNEDNVLIATPIIIVYHQIKDFLHELTYALYIIELLTSSLFFLCEE